MRRRGLSDPVLVCTDGAPALIRAAESWRGIRISDFERRQLERLAEQLKRGFQEEYQAIVRESTPIPICSSEGT